MIENTGRKIGGGGITGRHNLGAYIYTAWESARFAIWRSGVRSPLGPPNGKIYRYVGFPVFYFVAKRKAARYGAAFS